MRPMLMTVVCLLALGCAKAGGGAHGSLDAASGVDTTGGSMDGGISATEGGGAREASVGGDHPADVSPPRAEGGSMLGIDAPPAAGCVVRIPADANLINVKTAYGAMGDGKTDDTAAIQKAISDQLNGSRMVYLPKGVYLVRDRLQWRMGTTGFSAGWGAYLALIGDGPGETVIRLADRAMGFGDAKNPRAVVYTASRDDQNAYDDNTGPGNQAFANFIKDLTVDVGVGNPGAVGIDFQVSNWGALRNVTVRSTDAGETGISLSRRDNGPGLLKHVRVEGFRQGLTITDATYSFVIEDLELQGQTALGVLVKDAVVSVASLRAQTAGPALRLEGLALVNLIGANLAPLAAGAASGAAVEINDKNAHLYARTMMTSGYGAAIMNRGVSVAGPMTEEFVSDAVRGLATPPGAALKLPIKPTPEICDGAVETWRSVGAPSGKDDTLAIQAALNSGAATVYFPNGSYVVADTLHVPATVKHVVGFESHLRAAAVHHFGDAKVPTPVLRIEGMGTDDVVIEGFHMEVNGPGAIAIEDATTRTLVVKDSELNGATTSYRNTPGCGDLFVEDVVANLHLDNPQQVWARQLNDEQGDAVVSNDGGSLWVLGFKSERADTVLVTRKGAAPRSWAEISMYSAQSPLAIPRFLWRTRPSRFPSRGLRTYRAFSSRRW